MIKLRLPIWTVLTLILTLKALILLSSCATTPAPAPPAPKRQISDFSQEAERRRAEVRAANDAMRKALFPCTELEDFSVCLAEARAGDANAAFNIAKLYDETTPYTSSWRNPVKKDGTTAFYWYKAAADLGHEKALRIVFDSYYFGGYGPENKVEAERYLKCSAKLGHQRAMLVLAYWSEKKDPENAMDLYLDLANKDNCHAQNKLAKIYFEGKLVPQDLCKSYFWSLLANAGVSGKSDSHFLVGPLGDDPSWLQRGYKFIKQSEFGLEFCSSQIYRSQKLKIESELDYKYIQMLQVAATRWEKGQGEPDFQIVQSGAKDKPFISKIKPPDSPDSSTVVAKEKPLKWTPAQIDLSRCLTSNLTPSEVFNFVNPTVWTVISASSAANLKAMNNILLASAVVISENTLLTNYHVIEDRPYVVVKHEERFEKAAIIAGDKQTDRCILYVENVTLKPVKGFRKYNSLAIGETVYSVGSPKGLENTLGQGIISGKREFEKLSLIQTTAQISRGSSVGGLFDKFGNLIGITTFKVGDSEGLNFALAIDDFTQ
jgi:serine protease Do